MAKEHKTTNFNFNEYKRQAFHYQLGQQMQRRSQLKKRRNSAKTTIGTNLANNLRDCRIP